MLESGHRFSFSQLQTFEECRYEFYLEKIDPQRKEDLMDNSFAQLGSLIHELIDMWAKKILTIDELPAEYMRRYPREVDNKWPKFLAAKDYGRKAYEAGLEYFENFDGFKGFKVISSEKKFDMNICGRRFVGVVDMILQDENTGEMIILDHKSKALSTFRREEDHMYKQQYMYSAYFKDKYGKFPDRLMFNLFKENGMLVERPFDEQEYNNTMKWADDLMTQMEELEFTDWLQAKETADFFCQNICAVRKVCPTVMCRN